MKIESYNQVGTISVLLNAQINELKNCEKEKEEILNWIEQLCANGELENNAELVRKRMNENLERFKTATLNIEKLNAESKK